jgi:hypothetical protein
MFTVEYNIQCEEFDTYRQAEIFCGENNIHCENIYEKEETNHE